jgi:hypothetical protein
MYRRATTEPGMSGFFDSIGNFFKGIKITAPPITLPHISLPSSYQLPGTTPPPQYIQPPQQPGATPGWVMPVALGGVGLLALMMFMNRGRK